MFPLSTLSILQFTGHDARQFLHNQLSADITGLSDGSATFACVCNPAGRVLGLLLVSVQGDSLFAVCAADLVQSLKEWLSRFVIRADVTINIRDDMLVAAGTEKSPPDAGMPVRTDSGLDYMLVTASTQTGSVDDKQLGQWREQEMKAGVVWLDSTTSAQFLPQMLGYETIGALSFKKGCFPGQEIIARTRYLGTLKRRPLLIKTTGILGAAPMDKVGIHQGSDEYSAVVIDTFINESQEQYLFLVVRATQDVTGESISFDGKTVELSGI